MPNHWRPRRFEIVIVTSLIVGLWFVLIFAFARVRDSRRGTYCEMNLKRVGLAMMQYLRDYDEKYPVGPRWSELLHPYAKDNSIFHCPATLQHGYALNAHLVGMGIGEINEVSDSGTTPMVFESSILKNSQYDTGRTWLSKPRHPQGAVIVFDDGHIEWRHQLPLFRLLKSAKPLLPSDQ